MGHFFCMLLASGGQGEVFWRRHCCNGLVSGVRERHEAAGSTRNNNGLVAPQLGFSFVPRLCVWPFIIRMSLNWRIRVWPYDTHMSFDWRIRVWPYDTRMYCMSLKWRIRVWPYDTCMFYMSLNWRMRVWPYDTRMYCMSLNWRIRVWPYDTRMPLNSRTRVWPYDTGMHVLELEDTDDMNKQEKLRDCCLFSSATGHPTGLNWRLSSIFFGRWIEGIGKYMRGCVPACLPGTVQCVCYTRVHGCMCMDACQAWWRTASATVVCVLTINN